MSGNRLVASNLKRLLPVQLKTRVRAAFQWPLKHEGRVLMQFSSILPYEPEMASYTLPAYSHAYQTNRMSSLPVPPQSMWVSYGSTNEEYLQSGKDDVESMGRILDASGFSLSNAGRILEFGCAAGRMIRWLQDHASSCELWGVDIWASAILWCKEHLSPPFHFATTTSIPHLPFEDGYFNLIYAGSIFTHIDDLCDAWFLELRRVLRPGGKLYFTINDHNAVSVFEGERTEDEFQRYYKRTGGREAWENFVDKSWRLTPEYQKFKNKEVCMATVNRWNEPHVLWDVDFLCKRREPFYRVLSINKRAYGHQTAVLLERL